MRVAQEQYSVRANRLKWHCRRALLELDLVFTRFWGRHNDSLEPEVEEALRDLLALEDHDLWALISGKSQPQDSNSVRDALLAELRRVE